MAAVSRNNGFFDNLPPRLQTKSLFEIANFEDRSKSRMLSDLYVTPVVYALERAQLDQTVLVAVGDVAQGLPIPALTKARLIDRPGANVLAPLNYRRHFAPAYEAIDISTPFRARADKLVWRGSLTGPKRDAIFQGRQSREWIFDLAARTTLNDSIDVAFTGVPQSRREEFLPDVLQQLAGNRLSATEQANNKLLLCVEGNDVASGLKWMLAAESCVLMPRPTVDSWFCESLLEPWIHYVPVASDLSDVEEKVEWCLSKPVEAEEVARNGREFARRFLRSERETLLFDDVIRWLVAQPELHDVLNRATQVIAAARGEKRLRRFVRFPKKPR